MVSLRPVLSVSGVDGGNPYSDFDVPLPRDFVLDSGRSLAGSCLRVRIYGAGHHPVVVVSGGISSGRVVADALEEGHLSRGWWRDIVHAGGPVDLSRLRVAGFEFLPDDCGEVLRISTADQARALACAFDELGIDHVRAFIGASYGGMVGLSFAALFPARLSALCVISGAHRASPPAIAFRGIQRRIIRFAMRTGNPHEGVALARELAMISYRTPEEFCRRFDGSRSYENEDLFDVCAYLVSRGNAFGMCAERYLSLSESIDSHRVDPSVIMAEKLFMGASGDRLVTPDDMRALAQQAGGARLVEIDSLYGHDTFLKETGVIGRHIGEFLGEK